MLLPGGILMVVIILVPLVVAVVMSTLRQLNAVVEVMGWDEAFIGARTDDPVALATFEDLTEQLWVEEP